MIATTRAGAARAVTSESARVPTSRHDFPLI